MLYVQLEIFDAQGYIRQQADLDSIQEHLCQEVQQSQ